jgi:transcriptional regulator with XRE-family HTH domain
MGVHHVYMSKKLTKHPKPRELLRWRQNNISLWREAKTEKSQQDVADWLTEQGLPLDRVSILRIEAGKQMPSIEVLEAMARLYRTDVSSMCDLTPEEAADIQEFKALQPTERKRVLRTYKVAHDRD